MGLYGQVTFDGMGTPPPRHTKGTPDGGRFAPDEPPAATDTGSLILDDDVLVDPVAGLYDKMTFDAAGFDGHGYNRDGFNEHGEHRNGSWFGDDGFDEHGYNRDGFNNDGYHHNGTRYNNDGFDKDGDSRF